MLPKLQFLAKILHCDTVIKFSFYQDLQCMLRWNSHYENDQYIGNATPSSAQCSRVWAFSPITVLIIFKKLVLSLCWIVMFHFCPSKIVLSWNDILASQKSTVTKKLPMVTQNLPPKNFSGAFNFGWTKMESHYLI